MKIILLYKYNFIFNITIINNYSLSTEKHLSIKSIEKLNFLEHEVEEKKSFINIKYFFKILENYKNRIYENSSKNNLILFKTFLKEIFSLYFMRKSLKKFLFFFINYIAYLVLFCIGIYFIFFYGIQEYFIKPHKFYLKKEELLLKTFDGMLNKIIYNKSKENFNKNEKRLYESIDILLDEIKNKYTILSPEENKLFIDKINYLTYYHYPKIQKIINVFICQDKTKITKDLYIDLLNNIYWSLDIFIELMEKNLISTDLLKNILSIISFLLPTQEIVLHIFSHISVLKACQNSLKLLIKRQMKSDEFKLFKTHFNNKLSLLSLEKIPLNQIAFYSPFHIFDNKFYKDIIHILAHTIKNHLEEINFNLFLNWTKGILIKYISNSYLQTILKQIFLYNIKFSIKLFKYSSENLNISEENMINYTEKERVKKDERIFNFLVKKAPFIKEEDILIFDHNNEPQDITYMPEFPNYNDITNKKIDNNLSINEVIKDIFNIHNNKSIFYKNILEKTSNILSDFNKVHKTHIKSIFTETNNKDLLKIRLNIRDLFIYIIENLKNKDIVYFFENIKVNLLKITKFIPNEKLHLFIRFLTYGEIEDYVELILNLVLRNQKNINKDSKEYKELFNLLKNICKKFIPNIKSIEKNIYNKLIVAKNIEDFMANLFNKSNSKNISKDFMQFILCTYYFYQASNKKDMNINQIIEIMKNIDNKRHTSSEEKSFYDLKKNTRKYCEIINYFNNKYDFNLFIYSQNIYKIINLFISNNSMNHKIKKILEELNIMFKKIINNKNINNQEPFIFFIEDFLKDNRYIKSKVIKNCYLDIVYILQLIFDKIDINSIIKNTYSQNDKKKAFKKEISDLIINILEDSFFKKKIIDLLNKIYLDNKIVSILVTFHPEKIINLISEFFIREIKLIDFSLPSNIIILNLLSSISKEDIIDKILQDFADESYNNQFIKFISLFFNKKYKLFLEILKDENKFYKIYQILVNYNDISDWPDIIKKEVE
jgi:hypothetical protein